MVQKERDEIFSKIADYVQHSVFPGLPQHLYYHNDSHTILDVLPASIKLAEMECVAEDDLFLLEVAVLFHDTGFVERYPNNEEIGVKIARKILPGFGFSKIQISRIKKIIMATRFSTQKHKVSQMAGDDILEQIICDADLDNLGRDDFFEKSAQLRKEMFHFGITMSDKEWNEYQILILESHRYLTASARKLRREKQLENLAKLKQEQKTYIK